MPIRCSGCGNVVPDDAAYCHHCGAGLLVQKSSGPATCPACNRTFDDGSKYCVYDGTELGPVKLQVPVCPECHRIYGDNIKYCEVDGALLEMAPNTMDSVFEHVYSNHVRASAGLRLAAALLDGIISIGLAIPALFCVYKGVAHYRDMEEYTVLAVILYVLPLTYSLIKDGMWQGQSIGKRAAGIRVVHLATNEPCSKGRSSIRCLMSMMVVTVPYVMVLAMHAPGASIVYLLVSLIEPVMVLARSDGRKIADLVADTQVINYD